MPFESEAKKRIKQQIEDLKKTGIDTNSLLFMDLQNSLDALMLKTEIYYMRDENRRYPKVTEQERGNILTLYSEAANACQKLLGDNADNQALKDISMSLSKDIAALSIATIGPATNLPRIMENAKEKKVDISNIHLGTAGANLSSRIPMTIKDENGQEVKGYFTKETKVDPWGLLKETFISNAEQYGEEAACFKALFDAIENRALRNLNNGLLLDQEEVKKGDPRLFDEFERMLGHDYSQDKTVFEKLHHMAKDFGVNVPDSIQNLLTAKGKITNFDLALFYIGNGINKVSTNKGIYVNELGLHQGDNIDKRNAAMSTVAGILGVPNLIVKSVPVTVINNGVETKGTFLPNAQGLDLNNFDKSIPGLNSNPDNYTNTNAYKDLADIQILDYICGNIDRHMGNLLYKYDDKGKFIGVQGIDNDASFGVIVPGRHEGYNQLPALDDMGFISESMANNVMKLTPEMLRTSLLSHGLDDAEINAACTRLENMQNTIRDGREYYRNNPGWGLGDITKGHIRIIPDNDFEKIDFMEQDLFRKMSAAQTKPKVFFGPSLWAKVDQHLNPDPKDLKNKPKEYKLVNQPTVRVYEASNALGMNDQANAYTDKLKELNKVDKWFIPSSTHFKNMKLALSNLRNITNEYRGRTLDQAGFDRMEKELKSLDEESRSYVTTKSQETDRSAYAESRLSFARAFRNFVAEKRAEINGRIKDEVETREDRVADAREMMNEIKAKTENQPMTPQLAGELIKTANEASKMVPIKNELASQCEAAVSHAIKYLKDTPDGIKDSGLSKKDLADAIQTVQKGLTSKGMKAEEVNRSKQIEAVRLFQ